MHGITLTCKVLSGLVTTERYWWHLYCEASSFHSGLSGLALELVQLDMIARTLKYLVLLLKWKSTFTSHSIETKQQLTSVTIVCNYIVWYVSYKNSPVTGLQILVSPSSSVKELQD